MQCPYCGQSDLHQADRNGVEIDICPNCGGVWLDRGELELLLDRSQRNPEGDETSDQGDRFQRFRRVYDGEFRRSL